MGTSGVPRDLFVLALIPSAADREKARFYESVLQKLDEDLKGEVVANLEPPSAGELPERVATCIYCGTALWVNQECMDIGNGWFHPICWERKRAEKAEAALSCCEQEKAKLVEALEEADATLSLCRYDDEPIACNCDIHAARRLIRAALQLVRESNRKGDEHDL